MKFRTSTSITKLVLLLMTLVLAFQTIYLTLQWVETSLFNNVMIALTSFYFGQKAIKYDKPDSLITEPEKKEE